MTDLRSAGARASSVLVIGGSTRPGRIAPEVARWVVCCAPPELAQQIEVVDLADWPLPDDEPGIPARDSYVHAHTRVWSEKVAHAHGFVFVTPQYNWGYPAALKNALDHLYREWSGKPAMVVSYGFRGGAKASAQLRQVLDGLHMSQTAIAPALTLPEEMKHGEPLDAARMFASAVSSVEAAFRELQGLLSDSL